MKKTLVVLLCCVLLAQLVFTSINPPLTAKVQAEAPQDDLWFVVDLTTTPLAKGIEQAYQGMSNKPEGYKHDKETNPAKLKAGDKLVGRASQNEVIIDYRDASQKGNGGSNWDPVEISIKPEKGLPNVEESFFVPATTNDSRGQGAKNSSAGFFSSVNDDLDCIDTVTGEHFTNTACFVGDPTDHQLIQTLNWIEGGAFCQHTSDPSVIFPVSECTDRALTTLEESIDEDPAENSDADHDGNLSDLSDGINNDNDCVDSAGAHFSTAACMDGEGNFFVDRFPLIDEDVVDENGLPVGIDNDGDGLVDEDPVGSLSDPIPPGQDAQLELCKGYYDQLGVPFNQSDDYDPTTGTCNLDNAIVKGINQSAEAKFGKRVFNVGETDKNDWTKGVTMTGRNAAFTYPKDRAYQITLTVTDTANTTSNSCRLSGVQVKDGVTLTESCTGTGSPSANFTMSCTGLACQFNASTSGESLDYLWDLGNLPTGDHGYSQANANAYNKNGGPRQVTVSETVVVSCPVGWEYEEDDTSPDNAKKMRCRKIEDTAAAAPKRLFSFLNPGSAESQVETETSFKTMMGFTIAPPVLQWGWKIDEEVCVFGWCFEVFYARIGYEFDLGVGFRLPVEMNISSTDSAWPGDIWAQTDQTIQATIKPLDFSQQDYYDFCVENKLDDLWYIDSCDRFSFPSFLNSDDGDEFVAYYKIFAGIIVRVLSIPIITWGVDSSFDLVQACTMYNVINDLGFAELLKLAQNLGDYMSGDGAQFYADLKDMGILCNSFTTPYGYDTDGNRRTFPLPGMKYAYDIPADCMKAVLEKKVVTIKGKVYPICTNLIVGIAGANLGVGLELEVSAGSEDISASWTTAGDIKPVAGPQRVDWIWRDDHHSEVSPPQPIGPVTYDNYDLGKNLANDIGTIKVDDFTYYLNLWVALYAKLEFGGILSPIPDIAKLKLFEISFGDVTGTEGIPIPQHPGVDPLQISVPVKNYGTQVNASPNPVTVPDPNDLFVGTIDLQLTNLGSLSGSFDNLRYRLSNLPDQSPPYTYEINHDNDLDGQVNEDLVDQVNNDNDCTDAAGNHFTGAECFEGDVVKEGLFALIDEDPGGDDWTAEFTAAEPVGPIESYQSQSLAGALKVYPFKHSMTGPGLYPVKVLADSLEAKTRMWNPLFPNSTGNPIHLESRLDAYDVTFIEVVQFFDPWAIITPPEAALLPGGSQLFNVLFLNGGNVPDTLLGATEILDSNQAGCTLTTLGTQLECPYRAAITQMPENWIVDELPGTYGPLPAGAASGVKNYTVNVPPDWAGMSDTIYTAEVSAYSTSGNLTNTATIKTIVQATLESRIRYIGLEVDELIQQIQSAKNQGVSTCGLLPIALYPVKLQNSRALDLALEAKPDQAQSTVSAELKIMQGAWMHALEGCKSVPADVWGADWTARGDAIMADLLLILGQ